MAGLLRFLMAALAFLMISNIAVSGRFRAPASGAFARIGASILVVGSIALLATQRLEFFFPLALVYVALGLVPLVFSGLFERRQPTIPYDLSEGEDDEDEEEFELGTSQVHASRQGHRDAKASRARRAHRRRAAQDRVRSCRRGQNVAHVPSAPERHRVRGLERTEAERAARREKREKRDKRERGPRPPRRAKRRGGSGTDASVVAIA